MYLNILKKDLKRKKTMNVILLLFIILATTFVSSSVNNMVSVTTALDNYFELAGVPDYIISTINKGTTDNIVDVLNNIEEVDELGVEDILYLTSDNFSFETEDINISNTIVLQDFKNLQTNIFDKNNQPIKELKSGEIILVEKMMTQNNISPGEKITIDIGGVKKEFTVREHFKDALFGGSMIGVSRTIICEEDFEEFFSSKDKTVEYFKGNLCYITTDDTPTIQEEINKYNCGINFSYDSSVFRTAYILNMLIAGILMVISLCLIIISFVVLRFTIGFTISEEYREIGVMKAIGIKNAKIRGIYMVKYLALALVGTAVGFFLSIPLSDLMLKSISNTIVMINDNALLINGACAVLVITVILLFCYMCTGKTKNYTPVDAIRNGEKGKRFKKKGFVSLNKAPLKPTVFLAVNDVLSNPKRFGLIALIFTLCLSMLLILVNSANTLQSDGLITTFGFAPCDICFINDAKQTSFMVEGGRELLEDEIEEIERKLELNNMPGQCYYESLFKFTVEKGDKSYKTYTSLGTGTTTDMYEYFEGTAPKNANEIAITQIISEKLDASIGDTVVIKQLEGDKEYIITGLYQNMLNLGEGIRFHESNDINFIQCSASMVFQIDFDEELSKKEIRERMDSIKDIMDADEVYTAGEYADNLTGSGAAVSAVSILVLVLTIIVIILIAALMERSFIAKEKSEIALLKAVGVKDGSIIMWHTLRFVIVSIIATALALVFTVPLTKLTIDPIFNMMGASFGIEYEIVPFEVFFVYPLIVVVTTLISAFIASLSTKKIKANECAGIE